MEKSADGKERKVGKGERFKKAKDVETKRKVHILFPDVRKLADDVMLVQKSLDGGCEVDRDSHRLAKMVRTLAELSKTNTRWSDKNTYELGNRGTLEDLVGSFVVQAYALMMIRNEGDEIADMFATGLSFTDLDSEGADVEYATGDGLFTQDKWVCKLTEDFIGVVKIHSITTALRWLLDMFITSLMFAGHFGFADRLWEFAHEFIMNTKDCGDYEPKATIIPF